MATPAQHSALGSTRPTSPWRVIRRSVRNPYLLLWSAFLIAFPFYTFKSGLPQPADFIMVGLFVIVLAGLPKHVPRAAVPVCTALLLFTGYVIAVNIAWTIGLGRFTFSGRRGFFIHSAFYVYNTLVFLSGLLLYTQYRRDFLATTVYVVAVTCVAQVVLSLVVSGGGSLRATFFFNNANQLGYYSLLAASIIAIGARRVAINRTLQVLAYCACVYIAVASMSRAAVYSLIFLGIVTLITKPKTMIASSMVMLAALLFYDPAGALVSRTAQRFEAEEASHAGETLEEKLGSRGYDRIWKHPQYWFMGAGEGGYDRFSDTILGTHELHSSLGTLVFCYGLIGTLLFASLIRRLLLGLGIVGMLQLLPAGLFGLTHQGLRFSMLWVLLVMVIAVRVDRLRGRDREQ